ncbi:MAG: hypothetical protein KGM17_04165 [Sphingomonadales bacterium]|nr:hypothetical protein [Sphingomonadales bacterium]
MIEPAAGAPAPQGEGVAATTLRGALNLGGVSLARHQLGTVLAMGCERVICVAHALDAEMLALQQVAEHAGARFHVIAGPRGLLGLVSATDEIIALADGLSADTATVQDLLDAGPAVLVQPIEAGLAAGYERIDINHAAGGAWRIPGRLVERLSELPPDADPFSALMRIALQAGIGQRMLPDSAVADGRWTLVRSEAGALALENAWIRLHVAINGPGNPSVWLAQAVVRRFGGALLHGGNGGRVVAASGGVTLLLAAVAGWFGFALAGFALAVLAWLLLLVAVLLGKVSRATLRLPPPRLARAVLFGAVIDLLLIVLALWALHPRDGGPIPQALFAPVMLVGLCRLVGSGGRGRWHAWLQDRGLLAIVLAGVVVLRLGMGAVGALALAVLTAALVAQRWPRRPGSPAAGNFG